MGQQDMAGKTLESLDEVFSDIANVSLFDGREVIKANELKEADPHSFYKTDGLYHEQARDVAKYWKRCGMCMAFIGIENQTNISRCMPLRVISYDGGAYRAQLRGSKNELYPAVSLVLYFGTKRKWKFPKRLRQVLTIPDELSPYVNDYKIHVVNVAFLERETIDKFKSDFWHVADYFWQLRNNKRFIPTKRDIEHVAEVMQMMSAITGDKVYEEEYNKTIKQEKGGKISMDKFFKQAREDGERKGKREGMLEGRREEKENSIRVLIKTCCGLGASPEVIEKTLVSEYNLTSDKAKDYIKKYARFAS